MEALFSSAVSVVHADRQSLTGKSPMAQLPQQHPSEGQLWVRARTGLHTEGLGSFRLFGYLVLLTTEGTLQKHARQLTGHAVPAPSLNSQQRPK